MKNAIKAVKKVFRAKVRKLDEKCRKAFAKYAVLDNFGTLKLCYTEKGAFSWLPYCGDYAAIMTVKSREFVAVRMQ